MINKVARWIGALVVIAVVATSCKCKPDCFEKGEQFYKDIGSYPRLSTGELADVVISRKCARNPKTFD